VSAYEPSQRASELRAPSRSDQRPWGEDDAFRYPAHELSGSCCGRLSFPVDCEPKMHRSFPVWGHRWWMPARTLSLAIHGSSTNLGDAASAASNGSTILTSSWPVARQSGEVGYPSAIRPLRLERQGGRQHASHARHQNPGRFCTQSGVCNARQSKYDATPTMAQTNARMRIRLRSFFEL
jgi:hypothetical protein